MRTLGKILGTALCLVSLQACERDTAPEELLGTWLLDESAVDSSMAEARAAADDEERAALAAVEPLLRRQAGRSALRFTAAEIVEFRGAKSGTVSYRVSTVEGRDMTLAIEDCEVRLSLQDDILAIDFEGRGQPVPYRRLSVREAREFDERFEQQRELARNGPPADADAGRRMLWVINAEPARQREYLRRHPDMLTLTDQQGDSLLHKSAGFGDAELTRAFSERW